MSRLNYFRHGNMHSLGDKYDCNMIASPERIPLQLSYDLFQQITSWYDLLTECDYRMRLQKRHLGQVRPILHAINDTISLIQNHFDFAIVKPMIGFNGLSFELEKFFVRLDVNSDDENTTLFYHYKQFY